MTVMKGLTAALAAVLGLLTIPMVATGQSRPLGPGGSADLRTTLGDCPVTALRAAWGDMMPLEAVAVEAEVLRLCTELRRTSRNFGWFLAVVAIDRSDAKITVRRVQLAACTVHAEWNRA